MIDNIEYIAEGDTLLTYKVDGRYATIPFQSVQEKWLQINDSSFEFWSELDEETFEWGTANALNDRQIIATACIAGGQSGAVFIWDVYRREIVHISDGAFSIATTADNKWVYTLCLIQVFGRPRRMRLYRAPLGINDWKYS